MSAPARQGQLGPSGEASRVAEQKKTRAQDEGSSFAQFVRATVGPLSQAFAQSPLMQLRVRTQHGSVTLAKASKAPAMPAAQPEGAEAPKGSHARSPHAARVYNGEAGRSYDTINAEVVGVFRDTPSPPATGDKLEAGQVLGHIEALRLRNVVRCPVSCTLIAQVVVDGQPVDFGEPLFVVDSAGVPLTAVSEAPEPAAAVEPAEPPRL